ncbi:MAG: hypothetical protein ACYDDI_01040 [Candidatus Acidiferrales bacterium]
MPRRKKTADEIKLTGNTLKLSRAQLAERAATEKSVPPEKIAEAERLYREIFERRDKAQADVRKRGAVLEVTKYSSKGNAYQVEVPNQNLRIAQQCERSLIEISKFLTSAKPPERRAEETSEESDFSEFIARGPHARLRTE